MQAGRYVAPSPPQWKARSRYIVKSRFSGRQALVREAVDSQSIDGETWPLDLPDSGALSVWFETLYTQGLDDLRELVDRLAGSIAGETHCTHTEAALYLVADAPLDLPFIVVEASAAPLSLAQTVTLHVADVDAQAEEVRSAWLEGTRRLMAVDGKRRKRPKAGAVPMIVFDAVSSARGLSWPQRYAAWVPVAQRLELEEYGGATWSEAPAEPWRAYMNRVKRLRRNHAWLDELWVQEHVGQTRYAENEAILSRVAEDHQQGGPEAAARVIDELFGDGRGGETT